MNERESYHGDEDYLDNEEHERKRARQEDEENNWEFYLEDY